MANGDYAIEDAFPAHTEEAFQRGIQFQARYIGSLDVQRPQSRAEIVTAMRRVRFEFKAKGAKKRTVIIAISLDGVSLIFKRPPKPRPPASWHEGTVGCGQLLMHHPIYRIFYVSHDSQDLKIFSYIARDSHRNAFKCNVFKAAKKTQAVRIVRTIGQAFEICHQLSLASKEQQQLQQKQVQAADQTAKVKADAPQSMQPQQPASTASVSTATSPSWEELLTRQQPLHAAFVVVAAAGADRDGAGCPLAGHHSRQLMQQQLEHQTQQAQVALGQVRHLQDQLAAETAARVDAQDRVQQLLGQNRELLDHLNQLVHRTRAMELRLHPRQLRIDDPAATAASASSGDSPDSGHKEMSSESLSQTPSLPLTPLQLTSLPGPQQPREALAMPPPPQRRSLQAPASLDCVPRSQRLRGLGSVGSGAVDTGTGGCGSGGGGGGFCTGAWKTASQSFGDVSCADVSAPSAAAVASASASASAGMPAAWSEPFGREEPLSAAHLNHSFEWGGEPSLSDGASGVGDESKDRDFSVTYK